MKKKRLLILLVLLIFNLAVFGQFRIGAKAGVNYSNVLKSNEAGIKQRNHFKPGFSIGADVQVPININFYLFTGLIYTTKGATDYNETQELTLYLSYLEVPIDLGYKFVLGKGRVNAGVGLYFAYALSGYIEFAGGKEKLDFKNNLTENNPFVRKTYDLGSEIFAGYDFNFGLTFQFKAQLGLMNIIPAIEGESSDAVDKNTVLGVSVGYKF
jgi:hypothetical protein